MCQISAEGSCNLQKESASSHDVHQHVSSKGISLQRPAQRGDHSNTKAQQQWQRTSASILATAWRTVDPCARCILFHGNFTPLSCSRDPHHVLGLKTGPLWTGIHETNTFLPISEEKEGTCGYHPLHSFYVPWDNPPVTSVGPIHHAWWPNTWRHPQNHKYHQIVVIVHENVLCSH